MICKEWMSFFICGDRQFLYFVWPLYRLAPLADAGVNHLESCTQSSLFLALGSEAPALLFLLSEGVESEFLLLDVSAGFLE